MSRPDRATVAIAVAFLAYAVAGGMAVGLSWDEPLHRAYGQSVVAWYHAPGRAAAEAMPFHWYGALFDLCALAVGKALPALGWIGADHLVSALFATVGVVFVARLGRTLACPRAGVLAALMLVAMPRWTGDAMFNPMDVPFAAMMAVGLFALVRLVQALPATATARAPSVGAWTKLGLATGLALGLRAGALLLPLWTAAALAVWSALSVVRPAPGDARTAVLLRHGPRLVAGAALALVVAWLVAGACWPYLLVSPIRHAFGLADEATRLGAQWQGAVLFRGSRYLAKDLPDSYLPVLLAVTTPIPVLVGVAAAVVLGPLAARRCTRRDVLATAVVVVAAVFPPAYQVRAHAVTYDGIRHFLFVLPPLAVICGAGWELVLRRAGAAGRGRLAVAALVLCLLDPASWYVRAYPYVYVYFSPLAGGLERASVLYETDYWGLTLREAAAWLDAHHTRIAGDGVMVVVTNAPWPLVEPWLADPSRYARSVDPGRPYHVYLESYRGLPRGWDDDGEAVFAKRIVAGERIPIWRIRLGPAATRDETP